MEARTGEGKIVAIKGRKVPTTLEASPSLRRKSTLYIMSVTRSKGMRLKSLWKMRQEKNKGVCPAFGAS